MNTKSAAALCIFLALMVAGGGFSALTHTPFQHGLALGFMAAASVAAAVMLTIAALR